MNAVEEQCVRATVETDRGISAKAEGDPLHFCALGNGGSVQLAVPTAEHYLPMLYVLAAKEEGDSLTYFNDQPVAGSLTMTSFVLK